MSIRELCSRLNTCFADHPNGFFYGLEGNVFGAKNPEPRMSMAGRLVHGTGELLAQAILSSSELGLRHELSQRFTTCIVEGGWFTSYAMALKAALSEIGKRISGEVVWKLNDKSCTPSRIIPQGDSKTGVHVPNFTRSVETFGLSEKVSFDLMREHTYAQ